MGFFNRKRFDYLTATDAEKLAHIVEQMRNKGICFCDECLELRDAPNMISRSACCIEHLKKLVDGDFARNEVRKAEEKKTL